MTTQTEASNRFEGFKPSHVLLAPATPLTSCFGKAEKEQAAALLVRACAAKGDAWGPVTMKEVVATAEADEAAGTEPTKSLAHNPFFNPDFGGLVRGGFAKSTACAENPDAIATLEFTEGGLERLRPWVRP